MLMPSRCIGGGPGERRRARCFLRLPRHVEVDSRAVSLWTLAAGQSRFSPVPLVRPRRSPTRRVTAGPPRGRGCERIRQDHSSWLWLVRGILPSGPERFEALWARHPEERLCPRPARRAPSRFRKYPAPLQRRPPHSMTSFAQRVLSHADELCSHSRLHGVRLI